MWTQQTWGKRSSRGQWPLVQVFGKKGQCIHILWCIFKSNITMIAKVCDRESRRDSWFKNRLVLITFPQWRCHRGGGGGGGLTLKWSRPSALPLVVKRGSLWTLTQKGTFPNEFGDEMRATDKVIQKNQNTAKKIENQIFNYKMAAKKAIAISRHKIFDQKWENHFPKGIFYWNLTHTWRLSIQLHCWNKIWKKLFGCAFMGKTNFEQRPKNANLC